MPTSLEVLNTSHGQPGSIGQRLLSEAGRHSVLSQQRPEGDRDVDVLAKRGGSTVVRGLRHALTLGNAVGSALDR
jgi:hypothetical protein